MNPPPAKKVRLTTACNECRRRKVKCDANYPKCGNCSSKNSDCFTSDPKRPDISVVREWVDVPEKPSHAPPPAALTRDPHPTVHSSEPERANTEIPESNTLQPALAQVSNDHPQLSPKVNDTRAINDATETSAVATTTDVSPVQQPYDMSFNLDFINNRFKMLGGSSSQCLTKSLDIYLKSYNVEAVSPLFRHGMKHSEEMELLLSLELIPFPDFDTRQAYLDAYFKRLHVFYPITDVDDTKAIVHRIAPLPDLKSVSYTEVPLLATAYLLMSLGADELNGSPSEIGAKYLRVGAALAGHSANFPYLMTVQCLLLLAVCYRGRNKDGMAWHTTGAAVRIAQSMGLHRYSAARPSSLHGIQRRDQQLFHARIWAICCCLEKMGQLESGRPSAISAVNTDQMMAPDQRAPGHDFLQWNMALAEVQHDISTHLYGHKPGERTGKQILLDAARLDKQLLAWPALVPAELRPGNDILCNDDQFHFAAFLSFQYHQAVIAVHRAALIQPTAALQREIDKLVPDNDARFRLRGGEAICVSSARAIARITAELLERRLDSRLLSAGPAFLACVVLATFIVKNPAGRMQLSDLELLKAAAEWTTGQFLKTGMDAQFSNGATVVCERVIECLAHRKSAHSTRAPSYLHNSVPNNPGNTRLNEQTYNDSIIQQSRNNSYHLPSSNEHSQQTGLPKDLNTPAVTSMMEGETPTMQIADILLDNAGLTGTIGSMNDQDLSTLPFEGYNLEELWDWMLLTDSGGDVGGSNVLDWANFGFEEH